MERYTPDERGIVVTAYFTNLLFKRFASHMFCCRFSHIVRLRILLLWPRTFERVNLILAELENVEFLAKVEANTLFTFALNIIGDP